MLVWRWENLKERDCLEPRCGWENNIEIDCKVLGWEGTDQILLAEDTDNWSAPLNMVVNLWFYKTWAILEQLWELAQEFQEGPCSME